MNQITKNLKAINDQIASLCKEAGRNAEDVNLVAVSKKQPPEKIKAALDAGQRLFGENRVQEAQAHWAEYRPSYPDLKLHLIGPLQTNKVKEAVALFDCIETVDRPKLVEKLVREMEKQNRFLPCFIQVNTGQEPQKSGITPDKLATFVALCREKGLPVCGLMCIPPLNEPPALHFAFLKKLAQKNDLPDLSMGMSADFEKAIALGANYVRLGTAVFGARTS